MKEQPPRNHLNRTIVCIASKGTAGNVPYYIYWRITCFNKILHTGGSYIHGAHQQGS